MNGSGQKIVPYQIEWEWAEDSSLLWFAHSEIKSGNDVIVVHLGKGTNPLIVIYPNVAPQIRELRTSPLLPTYFTVAVSPLHRTALSVSRWIGSNASYSNQLYVFDLADDPTHFSPVQMSDEIIAVDWNRATEDYLLILKQPNGLEIREYYSGWQIQLPWEHIPFYTPEMNSYVNAEYAVSASKAQIAIYENFGTIFVFDCSNTPP